MALINNLYPPILNDVAPAFIRTQGCKIYFSLSRYNARNDLYNLVQLTVTNLKNNVSALDTTNYPSGIKLCSLQFDDNPEKVDNPYFIQIFPNDMQGGSFELNQFYKIQLRFISSNLPESPPSIGVGLEKWLYNYIDYFSEWSNVCLIKGIQQPQIFIEDFNQNEETSFSNYLSEIVGKFYYDTNEKETEYLKSYNIKIYKRNVTQDLIFKSEEQYTNSLYPNEFNYTFNYVLDTNSSYLMQFTYTTNNLYTETISYNFIIVKQEYNLLDAVLTLTPNEESGSIQIFIDFNKKHSSIQKLIIKRTSSRSNFSKWENIKTIKYEQLNKNGYVWYDTTIESGIWYKYLIQQKTRDGRLNCAIESEEPVICVFEDIFLTQGDRQLKIKFNPTITGLKYNTTLSQQNTLGSKYPFIRKNGNNFYRSFTIGGLISSFMDNEVWNKPVYYNGQFVSLNPQDEYSFTNKSEIYGLSKNLYEEYNSNLNINEHQDYIYEREFRNKVCDFLHEYNIKIFRSLTEGNMLVKLMDISFEPITTLGRRLYSFSATAIEVDDFIISNLIKYHTINKFYYSLREQELQLENGENFIPFESLFQKIYNYHIKQNQELLTISKITIEPSVINQVIYIKKSNLQGYLRIIIQTTTSVLQITEGNLTIINDIIRASKGELIISQNDILSLQGESKFINRSNTIITIDEIENGVVIQDFFFGGIHLEDNEFTLESGEYETLDDITNPENNHVYKIKAIVVDNYNSFAENTLVTYNSQVDLDPSDLNYNLIANEVYEDDNRYIYYNNNWYHFNRYNDMIIPNTGTIIYYCKIKEEGDDS